MAKKRYICTQFCENKSHFKYISMEIKGKITQVLPLQQGVGQRTGNQWRKQEYVLETYDRFPRKVLFNFFNEAIDQNPLQVGDDINLSFDHESRSYVGRDGVERWSTDVRGWKVEKIDPATIGVPAYGAPVQQAAPMAQPAPVVGQFPQAPAPAAPNPTEDLPF